MADTYEENEKKPYPVFVQNIQEMTTTLSNFGIGKYVISVGEEPKFVYMRFFDYVSMYEKLENIPEAKAAVPNSITQGEAILLKIKGKFNFLKNLTNGEILQVVEQVRILNFGNNEIIFEQGESAEDVYFIVSGAVNITVSNAKDIVSQKTANRVSLAILKPTSIFGEMGPITKEPRSARAQAVGSTNLLSFRIKDKVNEATIKTFHKLKQNFVEILAEKLIEANKKLYQSKQ